MKLRLLSHLELDNTIIIGTINVNILFFRYKRHNSGTRGARARVQGRDLLVLEHYYIKGELGSRCLSSAMFAGAPVLWHQM